MEVKKKILVTSLLALTLLSACKNDKGALPEKETAKIELQDTKFLDEMENKTAYIDYKLSEFTPSIEDYKVADDFSNVENFSDFGDFTEKQKELLTLRRPKAEFKLVEKPISREEMLAQWQAQQEALQVAANEEQLEDQSTGEKLETTGLPTYDENNEDADLGKIADEREGQACTRVDVESL